MNYITHYCVGANVCHHSMHILPDAFMMNVKGHRSNVNSRRKTSDNQR